MPVTLVATGIQFPDASIQTTASNVSGVGEGQTWQSVTRASGTTYTNSTGKPIVLMCHVNLTSGCTVTVGGVTAQSIGAVPYYTALTVIIPDGMTYSISAPYGGIADPRELR